CLTAVRAAADAGRSTADFLREAGARGPSAAARVWAKREAVRQSLSLEMFSQEPSVRLPALLHLATFQGRPRRAWCWTRWRRGPSRGTR
ncbi:hypothetical protein ACLEQD_44625, partial [Corallococcus sp. 4LFB]